jgi:hypothetical protein
MLIQPQTLDGIDEGSSLVVRLVPSTYGGGRT